MPLPTTALHIDRDDIDAALAGRLIAAQFPQWADLAVKPVVASGWDNRVFHLGEELSVRLPSAGKFVTQVVKEHRWLPVLGPQLPLPIPVPVAMGAPSGEYPWPWSVYRWLPGEQASIERIVDLNRFAVDLAQFLAALHAIDSPGGPPAGPDTFDRGVNLAVYDAETRQAIAALDGQVDAVAVTAVWEAALATTWDGVPVWFHGDVAVSNLLVEGGRLSAVIDFGRSGVGDPACDLAIAWTLFDESSRTAFRAARSLNDATWARGRGWALWKALTMMAGLPNASYVGYAAWVRKRGWTPWQGLEKLNAIHAGREKVHRIVDAVLADHAPGG